MLKFVNPEDVHPPLGLYTHTVEVPAGTTLMTAAMQGTNAATMNAAMARLKLITVDTRSYR